MTFVSFLVVLNFTYLNKNPYSMPDTKIEYFKANSIAKLSRLTIADKNSNNYVVRDFCEITTNTKNKYIINNDCNYVKDRLNGI